MNKTYVGAIALVLVSLFGLWFFTNRTQTVEQKTPSYVDTLYRIGGHKVTLVQGRSEQEVAPGSASKVVTTYFGNEATGDLNGDGVADVAFLIKQETGGSGIFYYAVAAIKTTDGYVGTDAVLLGDRIAPQTTEVKDGLLTVNYADRAQNESFAVQPSFGKSLVLKLDPATLQFGEVVQNFEGEADPARMTLGMHTWTWISTKYSDGKTVTPKKEKAFTLTFKEKNTFSATTDCNGVGGSYVAKNEQVAFSDMISTMMYCDGSQEAEFTKMLTEAQGYHFTSKGELIFDLKFDSGSVIFR